MQPREYRFGAGVSLLQLDAPILQFIERNRLAGNRATNEAARTDDAIIAVEIAKLGLAGGKRNALEAIHDRNGAKKLR